MLEAFLFGALDDVGEIGHADFALVFAPEDIAEIKGFLGGRNKRGGQSLDEGSLAGDGVEIVFLDQFRDGLADGDAADAEAVRQEPFGEDDVIFLERPVFNFLDNGILHFLIDGDAGLMRENHAVPPSRDGMSIQK